MKKLLTIILLSLIAFSLHAEKPTVIIAVEDPSEAYRQQGLMYFDEGKLEKAIGCFDKAIKENPNNTDALNNRGAVYYRMEKYKKSLDDYNKAIKLNSRDIKAICMRAAANWNLRITRAP